MTKREKMVKAWMLISVHEYEDGCGGHNCTKLAEDAADAFDLYVDKRDYQIFDWVFELAANVADAELAARS